ncbi:phosphatase PAP2 family protein [Streptomyces sp. NPDC003002]
MDVNERYGYGRGRRLSLAGASAGAGAGAVVWLTPGGGPGHVGPVHVTTESVSVSVYRALTTAVTDGPSWTRAALEAASEGTLLALGLLLLWVGWTALRRRDRRSVAGVALVGVATVVAYALSEALKLLIDEERPCRSVPGAPALAACPEPGDWSFPSNHATLAVALAVGVTLLWPRLAALALPLATAGALLRVLLGVHYPHDVLAGAALGASVVAALWLAALPAAVRAGSALTGRGRRRRDHARLVGDHRRRGPAGHARAGQDRADVGLHRPLRQMQPARDAAVGQPAAQEGEYLPFAVGQGVDADAGGGAASGLRSRAPGGEAGDDAGGDLR